MGVRPPARDVGDGHGAAHLDPARRRLDSQAGRGGRPEAPPSSTSTAPGTAPPSPRSDARTESTPSAPSSLVPSSSRSTASRRRRSIHTGRHGPTAAGPGANPGARPSSIVRKKRKPPSTSLRAPARPGPTPHAQLRAQCPAAYRQLVATLAQQRADLHRVRRRTSSRSAAASAAVEKDLGERRDAVEAEHDLLAARRRRRLKSGAKPPVLCVEVARLARAASARRRAAPRRRFPARSPRSSRARRVRLGSVREPGAAAAVSQPSLKGTSSGPRRWTRGGVSPSDCGSSRGHRPAPRSSPPTPLPSSPIAAAGSNWRRRASLKESVLQPSTIRRHRRDGGPPAPRRAATRHGRRRPRMPSRPCGPSRRRSRGRLALSPSSSRGRSRESWAPKRANGLGSRAPSPSCARSRSRGCRPQLSPSQARPRVKAGDLGVGRQYVLGEARRRGGRRRGSPRRRARSTPARGSSAGARPRGRSPRRRPSS